ncbi:GNAT family N-acetyltransferase [Shouchella patagoniensis]|uniref:GNAT family N-acetyltransferase n=1 Tax=Shouchella patagoniensis TaxID=228576 RepID=UPI000995C00D|nr:GNAT family N-acetyltransferase [Shouchella patagoniensis]
MIRQLSANDQEICLQLVKQKPAENLFIIGDIEAFGMETDFQRVWGDFNEQNELIAVLLKYQENYIPYANSLFDSVGFAEIMNNDPSFKAMSGLKTVTEQIEPHLRPFRSKRETYYAKGSSLKGLKVNTDVTEIATVADAQNLLAFLKEIPEFKHSVPQTVEKKQRDIESGFSRAVLVKSNGEIVASASTTAENSASAMIVGVATLEAYKHNGYATACVYRLCSDLHLEGKEPCLFYDNPAAGAIYKRIGFEDIGLWMMYGY